MIVRRLSCLIMAMLAAFAGAAAAQDSIQPGYWESTDRVLSPIAGAKTEQRCITPKDIARFMGCYINHHYDCVCPRQAIGGGKIAFKGQCVDHRGQPVSIEGTGSFTPTTLHLTARAGFKFLGLPLDADASTDAHRLGDVCPPGSKGGPPAGGQPETFR